MSTKAIFGFAMVSAILWAAGCGSGGGRTARKTFRLGRNRDAVASDSVSRPARQEDEYNNSRPEGLAGRDLAMLKDRERAQMNTLYEMHQALSEGKSVFEREEAKLKDIQTQIARHESALWNNSQPSSSPRGDEYDPRSASYAGERGGQAAYRRTAPGGYREPGPANGEAVLYSAQAVSPARPPANPPYPPAAERMQPTPYYPPVAERAPQSPYAQPAPKREWRSPEPEDEDNIWNPPTGGLFSRQSSQPPAPQGFTGAAGGGASRPGASEARPPSLFVQDPGQAAAGGYGVLFTPDVVLPGGRR